MFHVFAVKVNPIKVWGRCTLVVAIQRGFQWLSSLLLPQSSQAELGCGPKMVLDPLPPLGYLYAGPEVINMQLARPMFGIQGWEINKGPMIILQGQKLR